MPLSAGWFDITGADDVRRHRIGALAKEVGVGMRLNIRSRVGERREICGGERQMIGAAERPCRPAEMLLCCDVHARATPGERSLLSELRRCTAWGVLRLGSHPPANRGLGGHIIFVVLQETGPLTVVS